MDAPDLRASDADRLRVVDQLRRHLGDGRLEMPEFEERADRAFKARTMGDLEPLLADLPALRDQPSGPPVRQRRTMGAWQPRRGSLVTWKRGFQVHLYLWLLLSAFLLVIWAATGFGYFWPIFPIAGVGFSVGVHAAVRKGIADR